MKRKSFVMETIHALINLLFPRKCVVCGHRLMQDEAHLCLQCLGNMPHTLYHLYPGNPLEQRFYGSIDIKKIAGYFYYSPESPYHQIIHQIKYYGHTELGIYMGRCMATHLLTGNEDFFHDIHAIVPVPLAAKRQHQRGYNQCELLAEGISKVTGLPVMAHAMRRTVDNPTQTHLTDTERWENVKGIFEFDPSYKHLLEGKHILLIDDVTTTGATLTACAKALTSGLDKCEISIAALGVTIR